MGTTYPIVAGKSPSRYSSS